MKKTLLNLALIAATSAATGVAIANDTFNGRLTGMSGAGYVTGGYTDGVLLNPSLGAAYGESDDFAIVLNLGALASDKDDLIDAMDDLVDHVDYLDGFSSYRDLNWDDADQLIKYIEEVDNKAVTVNAGASLVVAIPNDFMSISLIAKARAQLGALTIVDESDYALILSNIGRTFDTQDLQSSVLGKGAVIQEVGIAFAKTIHATDEEQWLVGVTPKKVKVETIVYSATVGNYDEDDFDADEYTTDDTATSFDAGITYIKGNMRYGVAVRDAISNDFIAIDGDKLSLKPLSTAAIGYTNRWVKAEFAVDMNAVPAFGLGGDVQMLRAGLELSPFSWLQLRAGLQQDLEDTLEDTYSVGFGLSPFDVINLDIAAITGQDNTVGGAIQLGLRF